MWRIYLGLGVVAVLAFAAVPQGLVGDSIYVGIGASCVLAILVGQRIHAPTRRLPWRLMALGQFLWVAGDAVDSWYQDIAHTTPYPSWADACYLAAYPVIAAALLSLIKGRLAGRDLGGWIDSAIVTSGVGLLSWVLLAHPTIETSQQSWIAAAVGVAYPLADIVLVGLLVRLVTTSVGRTPAFRWLFAALTVLIAADTLNTALSLTSVSMWNTQLLDMAWLFAYLAWGVAALHPSMTTLTSAAHTGGMFSERRLAALTVAVLAAPATLGIERALHNNIDVWAFVASSSILFLLVVGRMSFAIREIVDANAQREVLQRDLAHQASHDALTELPNRAQAMAGIEAALSRSQRSGALLGLLFIDLDGFKNVNDTLGHRAGDLVLQTVAARLRTSVRGGDLVARLGGDEFVVLLESLGSEPEVMTVAQRIVDDVHAPIEVAPDRHATVGASVGVALAQDGRTDAQRLLHEADTAAYRAKRAGRGRVEIFDQALRRELAERMALKTALTAAIADDDLVIHYQPIVRTADGQVSGYEALVRWQRSDDVLLMPDVFIPLAENSELICELDRWVLQHATTTVAERNDRDATRRSVAVNISGHHICQPRIIDDVRDALDRSRLDPALLTLEITETVLIDDLVAVTHLKQLRELGVVVSIDDFGSGYNSITRLQHLPVDVIKIDRSFLDTAVDPSLALLRLMIHTAHSFGLPVVSEGVETEVQLDLLSALGCESVQGYLLGRPSPELLGADDTDRATRA